MKTSTKYFVYARKSTDEKDRQVMSLDSQMTEMRMLAKRENILIVETIEESRTAKEPGRPLFDDMLKRIERGDANGILCWDIDRLYRNPIDEGRVRWLLQKGVIASIQTPTRHFFPADAGLLMGVEGGRATDYIIRLARNVKRGREEKLRRGEWPGGQKTVGYIYDHRLRNIVPDPQKAKAVKTIFEEFASGRYGLLACGKRLADLGVTTKVGTAFSKSAIRNVLTNRLYIGIMEWNGGIYEGKFKPIISVELFKKVQQMLKVKSKPRKVRNGHQFPFCGLFRCSCGSMMTAQWSKGHGGLYRYYRCTRKSGICDERYLQEQDLAKQCLETLRPFTLLPDEASEIRSLIDATAEKESVSLAKSIEKMEEMLPPLDEKLRKLTRGYLDERIDEDSYQSLTEEIKIEKTRLKQEKHRLQKSRTNYWIEPAKNLVNTLETLGKTETASRFPEISELVQKIGTNPLISRKTVTFSFSEDYAFIPSLLASVRVASPNTLLSSSPKNGGSTNWCA